MCFDRLEEDEDLVNAVELLIRSVDNVSLVVVLVVVVVVVEVLLLTIQNAENGSKICNIVFV